MTLDQAVDLLTAAAMFDRRTVGTADAMAWHAVVGDLELDDAVAAVRAHYTETSEWLMPAHVRNRVKIMRRDRLAREILPAPSPQLADDSVRYRESLLGSIESIAAGKTVGLAIGPVEERGTGQLPAEDMAALKSRLGVKPKLTAQELARIQVEESRIERGEADRG